MSIYAFLHEVFNLKVSKNLELKFPLISTQETDPRESITEAELDHYKAELAKQARIHVLNDIPERPVDPADMVGVGSVAVAVISTPVIAPSVESKTENQTVKGETW